MDEVEEEFAAFLSRVIAGQTSVSWRERSQVRNRQPPFRATSLEEAFDRYSWKGVDYKETRKKLVGLSKRLRAARNEAELLAVVEEIMRWGGVFRRRGNAGWLAGLGEGSITKHLKSALEATMAPEFDADAFRRKELRSNAGMTKVYALARDGFVIYDSRVAAALQLLVVMFLRERGDDNIPDVLAFPSMASDANLTQRKVGLGAHRFPRTNNVSHVHMAANLRANRTLSRSMDLASGNPYAQWCVGHEDGLRRLEAALFMVGYDIAPEYRPVADVPS